MNNAVLTLLFDGLLAVLLIATIGYCARLSSRIRQMQDSRGELAEMIARFDGATERATLSMAELQTVSKKITEGLQLKIEKANFLADDLAFLIEKSSKLASQLEEAKRQLKPDAQAAKPAAKPPETKLFFETVRGPQLVKTQPPAAEPPRPYTASAAGPARATTATSLEAVLQRLAAGAEPARESASPSGPRTDAERELLEALKSGR